MSNCFSYRYKFAVTPEEFNVLRSYLTPMVDDSGEVGWEEMAEVRHHGHICGGQLVLDYRRLLLPIDYQPAFLTMSV